MTDSQHDPLRALVVVDTNVERDPRVRRQIDWLHEAGWIVDSLGVGQKPTPLVRNHFEMQAMPAWTGARRLQFGAIHAFLPFRLRFWTLRQSRFTRDVDRFVRGGEYDLLIFNDIHMLGWLSDRATFPRKTKVAHIHLDLHEWFPADIVATSRGAQSLMNSYHRWLRNHIASPLIDTRSLAADAVEMYTSEFSIPKPLIVRNAPPFVDQKPSKVGPGPIRLLHHGVAAWERGLRELIEAMGKVEDRFTLTFMLVGAPEFIDELKALAAPLGDRITFVPPAPMVTLAQTVNEYDAEVMFYPPKSVNLEIAFPNKFFEAIQGRLAMVIGPTKSMAEIVRKERNGVITNGWEVSDLVDAINSLTPENLTEMKKNSDAIAPDLCAEGERTRFFESIGFPLS